MADLPTPTVWRERTTWCDGRRFGVACGGRHKIKKRPGADTPGQSRITELRGSQVRLHNSRAPRKVPLCRDRRRPGALDETPGQVNTYWQNRPGVEVGPAITTWASQKGSCIGQPDPAASKSVPAFNSLELFQAGQPASAELRDGPDRLVANMKAKSVPRGAPF
jgi:hypothetical protein